MDFSMNEESIMLQNSAARYLKEKCSGQFVKDTLKGEKGFSDQMWREMADMGWLSLIYEEKFGGSACSFFDLFLLFQEIGRFRLPSPFYTSAFLSSSLIVESGDERAKNSYLPDLISGTKIMAAGILDKQGLYGQRAEEVKARYMSDGSYSLNGAKILVQYAHAADYLLISTDADGAESCGSTLFIINPQDKGVTVSPLDTLTGEKSCAVTFSDVAASGSQILGSVGSGIQYIDRVSPKAIIIRCGEMLGGLERVFDMTLNYVKERRQFDKPLGSLQVVQHYCVDMHTNVETARLITYRAASLLSEDIPCSREVAMAKAWCNEAYKKATWTAHQLHGGIGFCEEHDLHLYYKHAKALDLEWGETSYQNERIAALQSDPR